MTEGLEVTITYRGAKYGRVAAPATLSSEFAILKKDLAHLRVHSPSQKNVRRVNGSFILHWPMAGANQKVTGPVDSLHTRWFKLCSGDPEALKLREFLSIGVLIRSTASKGQALQDAPPGTLAKRLGDTLPEARQQPASVSIPSPSVSVGPPPPIIPPPRVPPVAPRLDRRTPPHLKRRTSGDDGPSNPTRQKLDVPEAATTSSLQSINTQPQPAQPPISPGADQPGGPSAPIDATEAVPQPTRDVNDAVPSTRVHSPSLPKPPVLQLIPPWPAREPGEMTPQPTPTRPSDSSASAPGPTTRPPPPPHLSPRSARPVSPFPRSGSSSSGGGDLSGPRRQEHDVSRLTRELWDTRRQLTAMQAREQALLDDLERLGARPESTSSGAGHRNDPSRDARMRAEADLRAERARRMRAERALGDVERECRAPFVVPALFQAFLSMSELSE